MRSTVGRGVVVLGVTAVLTGCSFFMANAPASPVSGGSEHGPIPPDATDGLEQGIVSGRYYKEMIENPKLYFDVFYDMGLRWLRIEFEEFLNLGGAGYDHPSVVANTEKFQRVVDEAHERGIKVLGIVGINSMPGFTVGFQSDKKSITQSFVDAYIESVRWHIENYDVAAIEIWNEPRQFGFTDFDWDNDGSNEMRLAAYSELLVQTYQTLKPEFPDTIFVAPATSNAFADTWIGMEHPNGDPIAPEQSIFNADVMREYRNNNRDKLPLDAISWHPYGRTVAPGGGPYGSFYYSQTFADYHEIVTAWKDLDGRPIVGEYPIWFTEYGFETNQTGGFTPTGLATQRSYYQEMVQAMSEEGVDVAFLYTYIDDDPGAPGTQNFTYGIRRHVGHTYRKKPIFNAFLSANSYVGVNGGVSFSDDDGVLDEFVEHYLSQGGKTKLGIPTGPVYAWNGGMRQDFTRGALGSLSLIDDGSGVTVVQGGSTCLRKQRID